MEPTEKPACPPDAPASRARDQQALAQVRSLQASAKVTSPDLGKELNLKAPPAPRKITAGPEKNKVPMIERRGGGGNPYPSGGGE